MASLRVICFSLFATGILAGSAFAQSDTKPLDLRLPPTSGYPVAKGPSAAPSSTAPTSSAPTGTTTAHADNNAAAIAALAAKDPDDATDSCDAAVDNKAQVHGDVAAGVVAGNHVSGNYESATVNITKPIGGCEHPDRILSVTAHVSQDHFDYRRRHH